MQTAAQALEYLGKYEDVRQKGIEEIEAAIADLQAKLARLTGDPASLPKPQSRKTKCCSICKAPNHTSRKCPTKITADAGESAKAA